MSNVYIDPYNEQLVFFYVISHYDVATKFEVKYFQQPILQKLFGIIKSYIIEYKEEPTEDMVYILVRHDGRYTAELTTDVIHNLWQIKHTISSYSDEWLQEAALGIAEWNNFYSGVIKMYTYLQSSASEVNLDSMHEYVQKVKSLFTSETQFEYSENEGHDFFDPEEHRLSIVDTRPTGYKFFDMCLSGGWAKKTLNVVAGAPKAGKSMWLCNMCANSVLNGDNCAYISLEMSVQLVNQRIGANLLNIPINEYNKYAADPNVMMTRFRELHMRSFNPLGALIVEEFPTSSATVYDLEAFLVNYEKSRSAKENKPFKFKNVYIDYINIMANARKGTSSDNMYLKVKQICEDVRAMAQRNDWCVVSLTQLNRQGMNTSDIDMTNISESSGLVATVDSLFGIISTPMMKASGVYYIKALALRNSPHMGDRKKFNFSGDFMRITEDPNEAIIPDGMKCEWDNDDYSNFNSRKETPGSWNQQNDAPALAQPIGAPLPTSDTNPNVLFGDPQMPMKQQPVNPMNNTQQLNIPPVMPIAQPGGFTLGSLQNAGDLFA